MDNTNVKSVDDNIDLKKVLEFAKQKHAGQFRADGQPYIVHPVRVARLVAQYKPSKNYKVLLSAALLHDTLEDTYTSIKELYDFFGKDSQVPSLVVELTTASYVPKLIGKAKYLAQKMQYMSSYALVIKLCDRLDNIMDLKFCSEEKIKRTLTDTRYIIEYLRLNRTMTSAHVQLIDRIEQALDQYGY